ncbi:MAG: Na+/H+ antiporter subunit D [Corynebacterium sp.]|nr:Na+/H+ antiporter subunit D [Corynebacterium sp.]
MEWAHILIPLPILLPLIAAGVIMVSGRHRKWQRLITMGTLATLIALNLLLVYIVDQEGIQTLQIGGWEAPVGITLVADRLSTIMLAVSSVVLFCVMWYAVGQGVRDADEDEPVAVFLPTYMLLNMGVNLAFLAGDMFNLYVGFEIFLVASYVLLTLSASKNRVRAGVVYVVVSLASSMVFLIGLSLIYAAVGTLNMAHVSVRMAEVPAGTQAAIFSVLLVAFGIKAAVFPLESWLPDSYPTAPSLVTAVFAGLLTKVGVYSIIRMRSSVFTSDLLDDLLMWVAIGTMIIGILGAMAQNDIKRLLSFTLVSHIGYMIMGVSLGTAQGLSGAIFYAVHHILVQTALFLVVGLIERQAGSSSLRQLGSLARSFPFLGVLYLIPALNLGGIPPFSGFLGKIILVEAAAYEGGFMPWLMVAGAIISSLLTLYTMVMVWSKAFWRDRKDAPDGDTAAERPSMLAERPTQIQLDERADVGRAPFGMVSATTALVACSLGVTLLAGPLSAITGRAAESAQDTSIYQNAVLGNDYENPSRDLYPTRLDDGEDNLSNRTESSTTTPAAASTASSSSVTSEPATSATTTTATTTVTVEEHPNG